MRLFQLILLTTISVSLASAAEYRLSGVTIAVDFLPAFRGERLELYAGGKRFCLSVESGNLGCSERFVGAVALVSYRAEGKRKVRALRERVVLVGQSAELPTLPPFAKTVEFVNGVASDLQLFGYDEGKLTEPDRIALREAGPSLWRHFRQEVFLDGAERPFAVLEWRHSTAGIKLLSVNQSEAVADRKDQLSVHHSDTAKRVVRNQ